MTVRTFRSSVLPPRERGLEFGRLHARQVVASVVGYQKLFDQVAGEPLDLGTLGAEAMRQIDLVAPALAQEITGIAEGAELPASHLAAINARTEILARARAPWAAPPHECSTVVKLSVDGTPPLAVQTWDWYRQLRDSWLVWEIPHPDGRRTTTLTEYGIVGKIGVNHSRVGVLFNMLRHRLDGGPIGAPVHVLARQVLDDALDIDQALTILAAARASASTSITVVAGDADANTGVSVELNPERPGFVAADDLGLLVRTNHFLSHPGRLDDTGLVAHPDTVVRRDLLRRRLHGRARLTDRDVLVAMDTHVAGAGSVCCHPDLTLAADEQFQTLATVTLDVAGGELHAVAGGPCTHPLIHPF